MTTFTWADNVTDDDVQGLREALAELPSRIDVLKGYAFGPNLGLRPNTADFGVLAVVERPEHVAEYIEHPEHQKVLDGWVNRMVRTRQTVHFTWDPAVWSV